MDTSYLELARGPITDAVAAAPSAVPSTWIGGASSACQRDLDAIGPLLAGLEGLLDEAIAAVRAVPGDPYMPEGASL